jgi:uncharacterized protein (TIGR02246 family)
MRHRFAPALFVTVAIAAPALAQDEGAAEQKQRSEIESVFNAWLDALNKHDGRAAAAFFAPGAPAINPSGLVLADSQDYVNRIGQQGQRSVTNEARIERVEPIGNDAAYAIGTYTATRGPNNNRQQQQGYWFQLFERRGGTWKIAASSFTQVGPARPLGKQ